MTDRHDEKAREILLGKVRKTSQELADDIASELRKAGEREDKWQKMCQDFVGCSPLADTFQDEPHEPEFFGNYIKNLISQVEELEKKLEVAREALEYCATDPRLLSNKELEDKPQRVVAREALTTIKGE